MQNSEHVPVAMWAAPRCGLPVNTHLTAAEAAFIVADCGAMAVIRQQLHDDLHIPFTTSYDHSIEAMRRMAESTDFREGIDSYIEKRPPRFGGITTDFDPQRLLYEP